MSDTSIRITEEFHNNRADKMLAVTHPEYSRAALEKLFHLGLVKKDNKILKPGDRVHVGDTISYNIDPLTEKPDVIPLPILYEDTNVIVIDKPSGIISHAKGRFWQEASVASFIRDKVSGLDGERGGIVHRLDRATSGVMICAKNETTLAYLQKQFHDRRVQKTYIAITNKCPDLKQAIIDAPIERDPHNQKQFHVAAGGKSAQTKYTVLKQSDNYSLIELRPKTGRTHQIRVHMQFIHCPIVGDDLYGGEPAERVMLHAQQLEIMLPDGDVKTFLSPIPEEFSAYVA